VPTFSFLLADESATEKLGVALAKALRPRDLVALAGGLGAGKTTLARAILRAASGQPALIVPSPTFTLVEVYETPMGAFWHFDLYRLEAPEQVFELGWEEALAEGDRVAGAVGAPAAHTVARRDLDRAGRVTARRA